MALLNFVVPETSCICLLSAVLKVKLCIFHMLIFGARSDCRTRTKENHGGSKHKATLLGEKNSSNGQQLTYQLIKQLVYN